MIRFWHRAEYAFLKDENDYDSYFEDTMRAGHYENNKESVDIMIRSSRDVINDLVGYGVRFEKETVNLRTQKRAHTLRQEYCFTKI